MVHGVGELSGWHGFQKQYTLSRREQLAQWPLLRAIGLFELRVHYLL